VRRRDDKAFTRARSVSFALVVALVMRNSVKSLQNVVNEAMTWLGRPTVSASALSQARYQLKHTAFIELNQTASVDTLYRDDDYRRFYGETSVWIQCPCKHPGLAHYRKKPRQADSAPKRFGKNKIILEYGNIIALSP
jgi:hypothetical protein